jgi:signal transduction histidine kinase
MPVTNTAFVRSTLISIFVGFAALLAIVGITFWLVQETRIYTDDLFAARSQYARLVNLRGLLQDAETGQRGYVLTANPEYLKPFQRAEAALSGDLGRIRAAQAGNPELETISARLEKVITAKMGEMRETIALVDAKRRDDAVALVNTDNGRILMDETRAIIDNLVQRTVEDVNAAVKRQQNSINALRGVTVLGALVVIGVLGSYTLIVLKYTRELINARREVEIANASLEERVKERTVDLARANDEIQRFAYIVTHDLRAPLVNIMGFTTELESNAAILKTYITGDLAARDEAAARTAALEDLPEAVKFIRLSTLKMDGLINAILKLSREGRRTLNPQSLDLAELLRNATGSVQHQVAEASGEITIDSRAAAVVSDRMAIEQIFGNILDNAVKYRAHQRPLRIAIRTRDEGRRNVIVEIEDNGRGIARQDHERVFDLFRRSGAQDQPGEGIGLAHVRSMVRNLGGDITLVSEIDQGTTFKILLPRDLRTVRGVS